MNWPTDNAAIRGRTIMVMLAWCLSCITGEGALHGQTLFLFPNATAEEARQVQTLCQLEADHRNNLAIVLAEAGRVLSRHPENRLARQMLARTFAANGAMNLAFAIGMPLAMDSKTYALADALCIAKWRGDAKAVRALLQRHDAAAMQGWEYRFEKSEAEGDSDKSERILRDEFLQVHETGRLHAASRYAGFLLKRLKAKEALAVLDDVTTQGLTAGPAWSGNISLARSRALWLLGRHAEALDAATNACHWLTHKDSIVDRQDLAHAMATRYVLAMTSCDSFVLQRDARIFLANWGPAVAANRRAMIDGIPALLAAENSKERLARIRVLAIAMKEAPQWEDGLWASLYFAAIFPNDVGELRPMLEHSPLFAQLLKSVLN